MKTLHKLLLISLCFLSILSFAPLQASSQNSYYFYGLKFNLYQPDKGPAKALFVLLHGCKMDADYFANLTEFPGLVDSEQIALLIPEQSLALNSDSCWNWFLEQNQNLTNWGETETITESLRLIQSQLHLGESQTFLVGFSAGAGLASDLFYCHPELFSGVALHSGPAYKSAENLQDAEKSLVSGSQKTTEELATAAFNCARPKKLNFKKMILFQGLADSRVAPINTQNSLDQFLGFYDYLDDHQFNHSNKNTEVISPRTDPKFPFIQKTIQISNRAELNVFQIQNLGHLWSGGLSGEAYAEPNSYSATQFIIKNFLLNAGN